MLRPALCVLLASLTVAAPSFGTAGDQPSVLSSVVARFVVLGETGGETVAWARAVVEPGYACPTLVAAGADVAMSTRENPHFFPVNVCEGRAAVDAPLSLRLTDGSLSLPTVTSDPKRVLVFGDTGCKLGTGKGQCAAGTPAEPFRSLATAAASGEEPDLVIHLGDYDYRGTPGPILFSQPGDAAGPMVQEWPYDAGDGVSASEACEQNPDSGFYSQNATNSNAPDRWQAWSDDFFTAAGDLLAAAPWVFARGNHELCSRGGPGFFYFLDSASNLGDGQRRCPPARATAPPLDNVLLPGPYAVVLGDLAVIVLDSANACDYFTNPSFLPRYSDQMSEVAGLVAGLPAGTTAWLASHRPIFGAQAYEAGESTACAGSTQWACIGQTLQAAVAAGPGALPAGLDLLLAGHMHRFQAVSFPDASRPPMVIVGTSGVELENDGPFGDVTLQVDGVPAALLSLGAEIAVGGESHDAFGYLAVTRDGASWTAELVNPPAGLTVARCASGRHPVCRLADGVTPVAE